MAKLFFVRCIAAGAALCLFAVQACADSAKPAGPAKAPTTFQECVEQQGKVTKSFPPRCVSEEGIVFIDSAAQEKAGRACKDLCGDGQCQEMVCMAVGCPCAETPASCPQDCKS